MPLLVSYCLPPQRKMKEELGGDSQMQSVMKNMLSDGWVCMLL